MINSNSEEQNKNMSNENRNNNIKIVAPASNIEDVKFYLEENVDEIYFGFEDNNESKWGIVNKRHEKNTNFSNIEQLVEINKLKKELNEKTEFSLTLNISYLNEKTIKKAINQIIYLKKYVDNFIIADLSLIEIIKKYAPEKKIILSCIGTNFNSETSKFLHKKGVSKIILPRHLMIEEIKTMNKKYPMKYEVMILNHFCRNTDGFCSRCHIPYKDTEIENCKIPFSANIESTSIDELNILKQAKINFENSININPVCAICKIKELQEIGIDSIKIIGRNNNTIKKKNDLLMIKKVIQILKKEKNNSKEFQKKCKEIHKEYYKKDCEENCYF